MLKTAKGIKDAPADGTKYVRTDGTWVSERAGDGAGIADAPSDGTKYVRKDEVWTAESTSMADAPSDTVSYVRKDGAWVAESTNTDNGITDAPSDGDSYVRKDGAWITESTNTDNGITDAPSDGTSYVRKDAVWTAESTSMADAPSDGTKYVRKDGSWTAETEATGITDAPSDGEAYIRKDAAWEIQTDEGITDAPSDGTIYARKDAAWEEVTGLTDAPVDGTIYARKDGAWILVDGTIVDKTASSTLALVDAHDHISYTNVTEMECTVPTNAVVAFPIGTEIKVEQGGTGGVTIIAASGVVINSLLGLKLAGQYGVMRLKKVATDIWLAYGDLQSAAPIPEPVTYMSAQDNVSGLITEWVGSITTGTATLVTTASSDFTIGEGIAIEGAGDGWVSGVIRYPDWLITTVTNIVGDTITLDDNATHTVSGNDVYHDDTAAINAAIIVIDGAIVMDINSNIGHINLVSNKNMYGEGGKVLYNAIYTNEIAYVETNFEADGINNVKIQGITFDARKGDGNTQGKELGTSSILITNADSVTVLECTFQNNPYGAIQLFGAGTNHNFHHNDFLDTDVAIMIMPEWQGALQMDTIKIEDNYVDGGTSEAFSVESGMFEWANGFARNILIRNNYINNKETSGIIMGARTTNSEFSGNTIQNCATGIHSRDDNLEPIASIIATNNLIANNTLTNLTWTGMKLEGDGITVRDNVFTNMPEPIFVGLLSTVTNSLIDNNDFINCTVSHGALALYECNTLTISNNTFDGTAGTDRAIIISNATVLNVIMNANMLNDDAEIYIDGNISTLASITITNNTAGKINNWGYETIEAMEGIGLTQSGNTWTNWA